MEILIPSDKYWKKSVIFGLISLTFLGMTVIGRPITPGYAPHMFAYNMGFFLPMILLSFGFGVAGLTSYLKIGKSKRKDYNLIYKVIPLIFILPIGIRFLLVVFNIVLISVSDL